MYSKLRKYSRVSFKYTLFGCVQKEETELRKKKQIKTTLKHSQYLEYFHVFSEDHGPLGF